MHETTNNYTSSEHQTYLLLALACAKTRKGFCSPNPAVGAVLVLDGVVLAKAAHQQAGSAHAERLVLEKAYANHRAAKIKASTLYVTLEPCCHTGKTPPCTEAIIDAGIKRVFYGYKDPFPKVNGQGERHLQEHGIECYYLSCEAVDLFYESYFFALQQQRAYIQLKIAMSLDGKIANPGGEAVKITGRDCQQFTHQLRYHADAILSTCKTLNADDPKMNARLSSGDYAKPLFVLDSTLQLRTDLQLFNTVSSVTVFHNEQADPVKCQQFTQNGIKCVTIRHDERGLDLLQVVKSLYRLGFHDVLVEAGGQCAEAFLQQNLVQRLWVYMAPKLLGKDALSAFTQPQDLIHRAKSLKYQSLGQDVMLEIAYQ